MTTPIPDLPEVPLPSQNRPDFEETVETFLLGLQPWADAANVLGGEMEALAGDASDSVSLASFAIPFTEWQNFSSRSLNTATGMVDGTPATVSADDTGTHTEHVSFGGDEVPNAGRYVYFTSVSAWQRIGPLDSTLAAEITTNLSTVLTRTTNTTAVSGQTIVMDTAAGPLTLNLPAGGGIVTVTLDDGDTGNALTIAGNGATIDGAATDDTLPAGWTVTFMRAAAAAAWSYSYGA